MGGPSRTCVWRTEWELINIGRPIWNMYIADRMGADQQEETNLEYVYDGQNGS